MNPSRRGGSVFIRGRFFLRQRERDVGVAKFIRFTGSNV